MATDPSEEANEARRFGGGGGWGRKGEVLARGTVNLQHAGLWTMQPARLNSHELLFDDL